MGDRQRMPIYEYECQRCSTRFEVKRSFNDNTVVLCPKCHREAHLIFSAVPAIFKGSGFYTTDSRSAEKEGKTEEKEED